MTLPVRMETTFARSNRMLDERVRDLGRREGMAAQNRVTARNVSELTDDDRQRFGFPPTWPRDPHPSIREPRRRGKRR
jgi:hypothetical protein